MWRFTINLHRMLTKAYPHHTHTTHTHTHTHTQTHTHIYIYIYIYRERERERDVLNLAAGFDSRSFVVRVSINFNSFYVLLPKKKQTDRRSGNFCRQTFSFISLACFFYFFSTLFFFFSSALSFSLFLYEVSLDRKKKKHLCSYESKCFVYICVYMCVGSGVVAGLFYTVCLKNVA